MPGMSSALQNPEPSGISNPHLQTLSNLCVIPLALEQYRLLKTNFAVKLPFGLASLREYPRGYSGPSDVDSGPVIFGLSTSRPGFMIAGARLGKDPGYLQGLLTTAEAVGSTAGTGDVRHYLFAPVVGEAILLAMKTACQWDDRYVQAKAAG